MTTKQFIWNLACISIAAYLLGVVSTLLFIAMTFS